jgi:tetratricopeptide (TPR) repeat protein
MSIHRMRAALIASCCLAVLGSATVYAQDRVIDDIRVTTRGGEAVIVIEFACEMRFLADTPTADGALLEVRMEPFDSCIELGVGSSVTSQNFLPLGAAGAHLLDVEYSSLGLGDSLVLLTFDQRVQYRVRQGRALNQVEVTIDLPVNVDAGAAAGPEPSQTRALPRPAEPAVPDYMINLVSAREPISADVVEDIAADASQSLYVSQIRVDGVLWHRLRLGFFESEAEAEATRSRLAPQFPRAWIGRAEPAEIALAEENALRAGSPALSTVTADELEAATAETDIAPLELDPDEIASMMADARSKLLAGDNDAAIGLYRQLTRAPGDHRPEAIEFLGLAYERQGQTDSARTEYDRYLQEFPNDPNRSRVEQRLSAVVAARAAPRETLRDAEASDSATWDFAAGLSQYYRRNENQFDESQPEQTTQSALLTDADFSLRRTGENLGISTRLSLTHYKDLLDPEDGGRGDQTRVSYGYLDVEQGQQKWDLRIGRQSLRSLGVLGRFDGTHFSYGVGRDTRIHVTQGYPVESTRDSIETDREFAGLAVEFIDVGGSWDLSAFVNSQTIDNIDARMGVGTEARFIDERRTLTAMVDYDIDFSELNLALLLGTWRFPNRLTLSALVDKRRSPILTTRNALIGQPVETVEEMLLVWSEEEVRQLALDRTAESQTMTLGFAKALGERLQLNFDATRSEIDATIASGGVAAAPGTGPQTYYSASLVSTGLLASNDVIIWNLRTGDADNFTTRLFTWDARFPIGRRFRINPRIRLVYWEGLTDGRERTTIAPALRFLLTTRNRYRLELELGRDDTTRTDPNGERETKANYFNIGYRASF